MWRRKVACHFAEQRFQTMLSHDPCFGVSAYWKRLGRACGGKARRFFRDVCRMVVEDQSDGAASGVPGIQVFQQTDELAAAVPPFDAGGYMAVVQVQRRQNRTSAQSLVFVVSA